MRGGPAGTPSTRNCAGPVVVLPLSLTATTVRSYVPAARPTSFGTYTVTLRSFHELRCDSNVPAGPAKTTIVWGGPSRLQPLAVRKCSPLFAAMRGGEMLSIVPAAADTALKLSTAIASRRRIAIPPMRRARADVVPSPAAGGAAAAAVTPSARAPGGRRAAR